MSKKSKIRWSETDNKRVASRVRVFNTKLTKTLNAHPEWASYLPDRASTQQIKDQVKTRADLNRIINSLERFSKKGAETPVLTPKGIHTTKWEIKEVGYKVAQINRARTLETKKANVSTEKGTMGTIESNNLKHKHYDINNIKANEWDKYKNAVEKQIMSDYKSNKIMKYKENYLECILDNLGNGEKAMELYDLVSRLDAEFMYGIYYDDPVLQIQFITDPIPAEIIAKSAIEHWKSALKNQ